MNSDEVTKLTITVDEAARRLGVGRNLGYQMAKRGQLPTIRCGAKRLVVPLAAFERLLVESGLEGEPAPAA